MMLPSQIRWRSFNLPLEHRRRVVFLTGMFAGLQLVQAIACAGDSGRPTGENRPETCTLSPGPSRAVARVVDAETLLLDDGSEVRLIGTLTTRAQQFGGITGSWPLEKRAVALLSELVLAQPVQLGFGAARRDRYGRQLAHVFVGSDDNRIWVQGMLLAEGLARAYAWPNDGACLAELLAHEQVARDRRLGLWSLPGFRPVPAEYTRRLLSRQSTLQIVQGRVLEVARVKNAIYLNFGEDWRRDFSVRIPVGLARAHPQWDLSLESLKGRKIEVRGWIERSNGPLIEISQPSELVILDGDSPDGFLPQAPPTVGHSADEHSQAPQNRTDAIPEHNARPGHDPNEKRPEPSAPGAHEL